MTAPRIYRIGQIVPSSNITMEVEVPAMLARALSLVPSPYYNLSSNSRSFNNLLTSSG